VFRSRNRRLAVLGCTAAALVAAVVTEVGAASSPLNPTPIAAANPKAPGVSQPTILSPEFQQVIWAQGSMTVENPTLDPRVKNYGYDADGTFVPLPGAVAPFEATKTEPDKNTYLVLRGIKGADSSYDYGTHFLFQGHETGSPGYITRVNLDADGAHRVTILATKEAGPGGANSGVDLPNIDGSTWDPWAKRLLFTAELGSSGGVWQATLDYPSKVVNLQAFLGRGGYEGIQNDNRGNLYLVEDSGGATGTGANAKAKRPNSYVYRFLPVDTADLTKGGKLQALQVSTTGAGAHPITWGVGLTPDQVINTPDFVALHQYGKTFPTKWITIATTNAASTLPGPDANALAQAAGATPFKRPENGQFRPGSDFKQFFFDETGDTNNLTSAASSGGFGSIMKLTQSPTSNDGSLSLFYKQPDQVRSGFDNVAFFSDTKVAFVEDAGDTLHTQRNGLDSAYLFDVTVDYSNPANQPVRFLAQGRDASATIDSGLSGTSGFKNEGDNEITGIHVSDGDASKDGILGARSPKLFDGGRWRAFYTQQHGDNVTYELVPAGSRFDD
jgi:hypothetical protein